MLAMLQYTELSDRVGQILSKQKLNSVSIVQRFDYFDKMLFRIADVTLESVPKYIACVVAMLF